MELRKVFTQEIAISKVSVIDSKKIDGIGVHEQSRFDATSPWRVFFQSWKYKESY
jgi:hypothetical protein